MKHKGKSVARVNAGPSNDPRNPRKAKRKDPDAPVLTLGRRVTDGVVVEDADGRWVLATRVVDTIDLMHRRRMIDDRQRMAGATYRGAIESIGGRMPCTLDQSRIGQGGGGGAALPAALLAARILAEAAGVLGGYLGRVVASVLAEGRTVEETARYMMGGKASQRDVEFVGRLFREGLTALADLWHPVSKARMNAVMTEDARPTGTSGGAVEPGHVVHATADRIFDSRKP